MTCGSAVNLSTAVEAPGLSDLDSATGSILSAVAIGADHAPTTPALQVQVNERTSRPPSVDYMETKIIYTAFGA